MPHIEQKDRRDLDTWELCTSSGSFVVSKKPTPIW